jgi:hypothetical protein
MEGSLRFVRMFSGRISVRRGEQASRRRVLKMPYFEVLNESSLNVSSPVRNTRSPSIFYFDRAEWVTKNKVLYKQSETGQTSKKTQNVQRGSLCDPLGSDHSMRGRKSSFLGFAQSQWVRKTLLNKHELETSPAQMTECGRNTSVWKEQSPLRWLSFFVFTDFLWIGSWQSLWAIIRSSHVINEFQVSKTL